MKINREGCTRIVILTERFAFKLPNFLNGLKLFLMGFISNMEEVQWSKANLEGFCPVVFSLPFGILTVMRKAKIFTADEFLAFDYENFIQRQDYIIPAESKANSFGWLDGQIVAIDYGN